MARTDSSQYTVSSPMSHDNGFQRKAFPFPWVPNCLRASDTATLDLLTKQFSTTPITTIVQRHNCPKSLLPAYKFQARTAQRNRLQHLHCYVTQPLRGPRREHLFQQFLYCCVINCRRYRHMSRYLTTFHGFLCLKLLHVVTGVLEVSVRDPWSKLRSVYCRS